MYKKNYLKLFILIMTFTLLGCEALFSEKEEGETNLDTLLNLKSNNNNISEPSVQESTEINKYLKSFIYQTNNRRDPFKPLAVPIKEVTPVPVKEAVPIKEAVTKEEVAPKEELKKEIIKEEIKPEVKVEKIVPPVAEKVVEKKVEKPKTAINIPDYEIAGVLWNPDNPLIMLKNDDRILKEGSYIDKERKVLIKKIDMDSILLEKTEAGTTVTKTIIIQQ